MEVNEAEPKAINGSLSHKEEKRLSKEPLQVQGTPSAFDAPRPPKRRRWLCGCCISCGVFVVALAIVILVLALTIFKTKDPRITLNSIAFGDFSTGVDVGALTVHVNLTLIADMSIKNPNKAASFKHGNSTTVMLYNRETAGEATLPAGKIKADGTSRMNVSVTVYVDNLVSSGSQIIRDGFAGSLNMTTRTEISGKVTVIRLIKKHVTVYAECDVNVDISSRDIEIYRCTKSLKI
ncbi:hypothetical protein SUGI_0196840 [Cryptomeria japonica]|uniref:uncharacterized protein LOC131034029 n=1 Tax=Cryptomeria japonica TaxID=3369 RepID=UPI00240897F9|nr:uncharacterized protein LOC131034029 [Cryptomeria japonica]GLJ12734.1 hypothetical protein SUGI_0196840 [Cryptomeria japonica]